MRPGQTEGVDRLLASAQAAAGRHHHRFVHTEYLLLGLLRHRNSATRLLRSLGYDCGALYKTCESRCRRGNHAMESGLKLTSRSQAVLKLAEKQREALGHRQLDTTHVLLGLVLEEEGIAGSVLRGAGITAEAVRAAIRGERDVSSVPPAAASQRPKASAEAPLRKPLWRILLRV